ncbi:MAG: YlbF family regulator [Tepidisphaeraceae bacterium]
MPVDTTEILKEAEKLGQLVAQHPAVERYKQAQKSVADDPEAGRMLADFDRQLEQLARAEQTGLGITDAQRMGIESLQQRIMSHIKIKNLNLAQVDFVDLLRKVSQTIHRPLSDTGLQASAGGGGGARGSGAGAGLVQ